MSTTRETFAGLPAWAIVLWYVLIGVSVAVFGLGVFLLRRKYARGRALARFDRPGARILRTARIVLTHAWIRRRDTSAGLAHLLVFYGFLVLFAGTSILAFQDDFAKPVFGWDFWRDDFYLGYSLFLDVFGAALVVGLVVLAAKRWVQRPARLDYARPDREEDRARYRAGDRAFVFFLFFLAVTGFLLEALRIAADRTDFEVWSPFGWLLGNGLRSLGLEGGGADDARAVVWWLHGVVALGFVASIPYTKAVHMLAGPINVAVRDERAGRRLPELPAGAKAEDVGYGVLTDLSWQHLLSLDACTKCGKCHEACPANATGYPLSPRDLVLDLREAAEGALGIRAALGVGPAYEAGATLVANAIRPETLWSCMQCMACVEICPVGIEHVPIIIELRRRLVDRGELEPMLQTTLETIYETGNSFGEPRRKRARWARELPFDVKDARKEPAEILWFVGDYASLDPRNQRATQGLARILHHAGVDFALLHDAESNAGCDVRRAGEEGLFQHLRDENIARLSECDFERILTSDPHSFHTIRNEYPEAGGAWEVVHHSQLLLELLESGALTPAKRLDARVTYHDPCTLGRYNGVYEPPRQVLAAIGAELHEMPRNRDNSFCCGAGGGRIWMSELKAGDGPRPAEARIHEAVALGALDYFVVCCPKDVTMYEDAIKTSGHQGAIELRELSELVLESLGLPPVETAPAEEETP